MSFEYMYDKLYSDLVWSCETMDLYMNIVFRKTANAGGLPDLWVILKEAADEHPKQK